MVTSAQDISFEALARREPKLAVLLERARERRRRGGRRFDPLAEFFGYGSPGTGFKAALSRLVGWHSVHKMDPVLGSQQSYDVVYGTILAVLEGTHD